MNDTATLERTESARVIEIFASRQGEGLRVGESQIFVRFAGCNLACDYCDTPESISATSGELVTLKDVLQNVSHPSAKTSARVVSLTGGEPLLQVGFLEHLVPALRAQGFGIYLETNGTLPRALVKVVEGCDWIAMDFKPQSAIGHDLWEAHRWFLEIGAKKVFVKMVLTEHTLEKEFQSAVRLIQQVRRDIPLVLQPATPWAGVGAIPLARLESWWRQASALLPNVRIIPQVHRLWQIR